MNLRTFIASAIIAGCALAQLALAPRIDKLDRHGLQILIERELRFPSR